MRIPCHPPAYVLIYGFIFQGKGMPFATILHDSHRRLGARLIDFGGWDLPVQYDGILAEHQRVRQDVGMFDTCHMDSFRVAGPGALDFLSAMLTQDLRSLSDGRCRYGFLLREDAGVLDDLIAYRRSAEEWMVVVNAGPAAGDFACLSRFRPVTGVTLTDLRGVQGKIDVQGPNSRAAVERVLGIDLSALGYFRFRAFDNGGIVSRTGYTGELGYEIFAPLAAIAELWERLLAAGVKPAGLGARDTLRLEAGLPLYGHELTEAVSPAEAGMTRYACKTEPFLGRDALQMRQQHAAAPRLVAFTIAGRQSARHGNRVLNAAGDEAGWVTSGSFSPTLGYAIGFAYVRPELAVPGLAFGVDSGRNVLAACVTTAPFVGRK
jgi:aminomethyltransferase